MKAPVVLIDAHRRLAIELQRGPKWVQLIRFGKRMMHVSREPVWRINKEFEPSTLSLERTAMMFLGSFFHIDAKAKDELMEIINAAKFIQERQMDVTNATMQQLVEHYNKYSGKPPIKRFSDMATARKRVEALIKEAYKPVAKPKADKADKKPKRTASEGTKDSWKDPAVATARAIKHRVLADGVEYASMARAFTALKLPMGKLIRTRLVLKEKGSLTFEGHQFKLVKRD